LMKFGTQQQIKTAMTVTWSKKFFKIQNGGRPPCRIILEMPKLVNQWTDLDEGGWSQRLFELSLDVTNK